MTIPPFPQQDLAKLVLGYLAEEQLMTAYDEFLQASPYLDALKNEYDRIFMMSLRSILAEYRALRIYLETCKPLSLRKKLAQFTSILEIVIFLINNVDVNRLHVHNSSGEINGGFLRSQLRGCDVCSSINLSNCECKNKQSYAPNMNPLHTSQTEVTSRNQTEVTSRNQTEVTSRSQTEVTFRSQTEVTSKESSFEATALKDLPGNVGPGDKNLPNKLPNETQLSQSNSSQIQNNEQCSEQCENSDLRSVTSKNDEVLPLGISTHGCVTAHQSAPIIKEDAMDSTQKMKEFNDILKSVCYINRTISAGTDANNVLPAQTTSKISDTTTFQDFTSGVKDGDSDKIIVPDSSTSENNSVVLSGVEEICNTSMNRNPITNIKGPPKKFFMKIGNLQPSPQINNQIIGAIINDVSTKKMPNIKPDDSKITILSDVKVDNAFVNHRHAQMPPVLKTATSTPLVHMQTITINGAHAYKNTTDVAHNFTKDEIMAMPTIILVPTPHPGKLPISRCPMQENFSSSKINTKTTVTTTTTMANQPSTSIHEPLIIDITGNSPVSAKKSPCKDDQKPGNENKIPCDVNKPSEGLVKTVDIPTHASLPKDNLIAIANKTSTPHILPPTRKSSSTPRRTSHVRVLDFTTPRRILHETINEQVPNENNTHENASINETSVEQSTAPEFGNVSTQLTKTPKPNPTDLKDTCSTKENKISSKRKNWDDDLRALIFASNPPEIKTTTPRSSKPKKKTKLSKDGDTDNVKTSTKKVTEKKKIAKPRNTSKKKLASGVEIIEEPKPATEPVNVSVEPAINIISGCEKSTLISDEDNQQNNVKNNEDIKNDKSDQQADTPETDRLSLQNAIGAKLNISDLLETPYKQALYEIQMETPKFLGPDIPDVPVSDIKIMDIPTPRFLDTPKLSQATPSSYSSRPTDYSSGGSYYKPDDLDYIPSIDISDSDTTKHTSNVSKNAENEAKNKEEKNKINSRPVRKCTKNVSYYNSSNVKTKDEVSNEVDSTTSSTSVQNNRTNKDDKITSSRSVKESKTKTKNKSEPKKKSHLTKKYISPMKRETQKSFMKIKPRRVTPVKERSSVKSKTRTSDSTSSTSSRWHTKKKNLSNQVTPAVLPAQNKSRRKSSTPRKLHCTKSFHSESSGHESPEITNNNKQTIICDTKVYCSHDSDTEQLPLRWSDDGSQDAKVKDNTTCTSVDDDITQIKEYIDITTTLSHKVFNTDEESKFHVHLIKRGFDVETAKIIERDLLDSPKRCSVSVENKEAFNANKDRDSFAVEKSIESDCSIAPNLQIVEDENENDEFELSIHECNEDSENYLTFDHDPEFAVKDKATLKDKFSMEVCIDDDVSIRLRATSFSDLFGEEPKIVDPSKSEDLVVSCKETSVQVTTVVATTESLCTPLKDPRSQCYEIFDSTLTSLDTPLKANSPKEKEYENLTEIVLEVESIEVRGKPENKKRKRGQSGISEDVNNGSKKAKSDTQMLLNSAKIQNMDIETVLSKLHGP